jgi:polar amino acid transport system ATP-binding protein
MMSRQDTTTGAPFLRLDKIVKRYGTYLALNGISFDVAKGQSVALIGPSGSGKSTVLRCINALEPIESGVISVDGERIGLKDTARGPRPLNAREAARQRESIGMVFQSFNLFPHMTAVENVMAGPRLAHGENPASARRLAMELLDRVKLSDKAESYPRQLSGGQQQRVAIARALAMRPSVMLFDEPTSALDPETVQEVLNVIGEVRDSQMTMLIATHEMEFARHASDLTVFMEAGQIVETGPSREVLTAPKSERCRRFLAGLSGVPAPGRN